MRQATRGARPAWLVLALGLLAVIILGWRVHAVVETVLGGARHDRIQADPAAAEERTVFAQVAHKDSLLAAAHAGDRDPFRDPAPQWSSLGNAWAAAPPKAEAAPVLGALLYVEENPCAQLRIGPESSDWLHKGEVFHGWTIIEISRDAVTIAKNNETVVLHSS
jgi:hypothetical protein